MMSTSMNGTSPRPREAARNDKVNHWFDGTHRIVPPTKTILWAQRFLPVLGITRVADVTGFDTTGIPVVMVVRPNARSLAMTQGAGTTLDAARASAVMKAIASWHAEQIDRPIKLATYNDMRRGHRLCHVAALPSLPVSRFHGDHRILWIEGKNLFDHKSTWVPFEMVHMDCTLPLPSGSGSFLMSGSGLASGNHPDEALSHALCELIEHDAVTLHRFATESTRRRTRVDLGTAGDSICRYLLDRCDRAGIVVAVWEITTDIGVAAFSCCIVDRDPSRRRPIPPAYGHGCHPSRATALSRALTGAAQSRLTTIAGSRDDVAHQDAFMPEGDFNDARAMRDTLLGQAPVRSFHDAPDISTPTLAQDVQSLLDRLDAAGFREAIAVDLTNPAFKIPVVRVIVPGLEPLCEVTGYVPGARAQKLLSEAVS